MARIPDDELSRLKAEVDLAALVRVKGVELKPHGTDLIGRCPFHNDKTPSLVVTPSKNLWHCLGACQQGGSVIDWVMKAEGISFRHAVELLRDGKASTLLSTEGMPKTSTVRRLPLPVEPSADDQTLIHQVLDYYHETLKKTPAAMAYLEKRGIAHAEAIDTFKLGFSDRSLGLRLPAKNRKEGLEIRTRLIRLGLYRESGHEHFNGSLVIPVLDANGHVQEIYGRKIVDNLRPGTPYHTYLPGPHKGIWNPACLTQKSLILCESLIDALSFWVHGFRNVTASYGVQGFTDDHLDALLRHHIRTVYLAYDRDEAGDAASEKLAQQLMGEGIEALRVQFPRGMDANDYIRKSNPADQQLKILLESAVWLGKGSQSSSSAAKEEATKKGKGQVVEPVAIESGPPSPPLAAEVVVASNPPELAPLHEPAPTPVSTALPMEMKGEDIFITLGDRAWRIRGLQKNLSFELLKVNIRASVGDAYYIDTLDLYNAKHRSLFVSQAAEELQVKAEILKRDLGRLLLKLEEMQEAQIHKALAPAPAEVQMTDAERKDALALLHDPLLLDRILKDFTACGMVGEETNKLVGYLAAVSRKLDDPLGLIVQSASAAGKTSLMEAVLAFVPEEDKVKYSAMTGQSLFYMSETNLKHKLLAIIEEEGAERASYALKLLSSEKELTIASTGKDPTTGRLVTQEYRVEGPVMLFLTTTKIDVDPELQNRCIVLSVDESREQTRAIHRLQRHAQTLEGLLLKETKGKILTVHKNAQRLLRPMKVVNPFALDLSFADDQTRTRRDQMKYLTLIRAIAFLNQYQRPIKRTGGMDYVEVTLADIEVANHLAHAVLGRSLDDLAPQTRKLLELLTEKVKAHCKTKEMDLADFRFTRRWVREETGWGHTQLKLHHHRLEELEYLLIHRSGRGQSFAYELLYRGEGKEGRSFFLGLPDMDKLRKKYNYDSARSGGNGRRSGSGRAEVGGMSGLGRLGEMPSSLIDTGSVSLLNSHDPEKDYSVNEVATSYRTST
jgi:DNA primase